MITESVTTSLREADNKIQLAEIELNRPHEDVMTLSACQLVRTSMRDMMRHYLRACDVKSSDHATLQELLELCIASNVHFLKVDIRDMGCNHAEIGHEHCDGKYCLSTEIVGNCLKSAKVLRNTIWTALKIND